MTLEKQRVVCAKLQPVFLLKAFKDTPRLTEMVKITGFLLLFSHYSPSCVESF